MKKIITIRLSQQDLDIIEKLKDIYKLEWPDETITKFTTTQILTYALRYLYSNEKDPNYSKKKSLPNKYKAL